ncbi:MAG: hypothetical protein ACK5WW_12605, partial [Brevundimonas sp.]
GVLYRLAPNVDPQTLLTRVEVHDAAVQIALATRVLAEEERSVPMVIERLTRLLEPGERLSQAGDKLWLHVPRRLQFRGGRAWVQGEAPRQARLSQALIKALKTAHAILADHAGDDGMIVRSPASPHQRDLVRLAYLAPDVQLAFLEGRQKPGLCLEDLRHRAIPLAWDDQRAALLP